MKTMMKIIIILFFSFLINFNFTINEIQTVHADSNQILNIYPEETKSATNEFDDATSLGNWQILDKSKIEILDVNQLKKGYLVMIPSSTLNNYWFEGEKGAYLYQNIKGNFAVEIKMNVLNKNDPQKVPGGNFNSAGIVIRHPDSRKNRENWVMYNIGMQHGFIGRETKITRDSQSVLILPPIDKEQLMDARLLICRINEKFYMYHWLKNEDRWIAESSPPLFKRKDFPESVQVGIVTNIYGEPFEVKAEVDYIRFGTPKSVEECLLCTTD